MARATERMMRDLKYLSDHHMIISQKTQEKYYELWSYVRNSKNSPRGGFFLLLICCILLITI